MTISTRTDQWEMMEVLVGGVLRPIPGAQVTQQSDLLAVTALTASIDLWHHRYTQADPYAASALPVNTLATVITVLYTGRRHTVIRGPAYLAAHTDSGVPIGLSPAGRARLYADYDAVARIFSHGWTR